MKKIISYILLLAMCLSLFAGCTKDEVDPGLDSAKTYLYNMYKDSAKTTAVSYDVVGIVKIQGVGTYDVEWTVNSSAITITPNGKMVTIGIPEYPEADINYTLTGTLKDAKGNTVSVSFEHFVPKAAGQPATLADGTYVILNGDLTMSSLAQDKGYGYPTANKVTVADGKVSNHYKADVLTIKNVEGGVTIQDAHGRYFYLKGTYNSFNVSEEMPAEGHIFTVLKSGDTYLIVNAMNKKTLAYSSSFSSWGCYPELTDDYAYALTILPATAPAEDPKPENPNPPVSGDPAADSTLTVEQVITLGSSKAHNTYTEGKYYVTGVITEVYNETYGNMKITDSKGNILTIYGTYDATGANRYDAMATKPVVGDTVTIYGIVGQYNNTPQVKNGWITAHTPAGSTPSNPDTPDTPAAPSNEAVANPVAGTAYKMMIVQGNKSNANLWFTGNEKPNYPWYLLSTQNKAEAIDVYLEEVTGGLRLYFMVGSTKTYLDMHKDDTHYSLRLTTTPTAVYTWNAEHKTLVATVEGVDCFIGTSGTYDTFSCNKLEKISTSFPACFYN